MNIGGINLMEITSLILSIIASLGTIIALMLNYSTKKELNEIKNNINGTKNIHNEGNDSNNVSGDGNTVSLKTEKKND